MTSKPAPGLRPRAMPAVIGLWAAAVALAPGPGFKLALVAPPLAAVATWFLAARPERWLPVFLGAALLTPPLPFAAGNSGAHIAPFVAAMGIVAGALRFREWRPIGGSLPSLFLAF